MSGGKGRKKAHEEEHESSERWLVTYADMLTLLMVLFIVLFAISQVDQKKFAALKNGLASGFGAPTVAFDGTATTISQSNNEDFPMDLGSGVGGKTSTPDENAVKAAVDARERAKAQRQQQAAKEEVDNLEEIKEEINEALKAQGDTGAEVVYAIDERGLVVTLITKDVVFAGNKAELLIGGRKILDAIGPTLGPLPNRIEVDGHTNQLNVSTDGYPSGWELSSARASTVVRYLHTNAGVAENRLAAVGFADTKPLYPATDPKAVEYNRRVEIVVLSTLTPAERALLPSAVSVDSTTASGLHWPWRSNQ